jgi:thiopeptide-type bacteriocin biosynthesis protein
MNLLLHFINPDTKMAKVQRLFYPGDQWLYFRIYTGIKTADDILVNVLFPLTEKLKKKKKISHFFFIRYSDSSGFHIRMRLFLENALDNGSVTAVLNQKMKKYYDSDRIHKIEIGTYTRELERYGEKFIVFSEAIFHYDSECILLLLSYLKGKDENYRWMSALLLIDRFLDDFGCDLTAKQEQITRMSESYRMEFGYNMYNAKQLNVLFRDKKKTIENVLNKPEEDKDLVHILSIIAERSKKIQSLTQKKQLSLPVTNIPSYLHMSMNRLFRSQNRTHELLLYDFLSRYYKSEFAKSKQKEVNKK